MNTYKSKNKLFAALTIMLLLASTALISIPTTTAITSPIDFTPSSGTGYVGDVITVSGEVENTGSTVVLYWNVITPATKLNSTQLEGSSKLFNVDVTIPPSPKGTYAIIAVEELASGSGSMAGSVAKDFNVEPSITLSKYRGLAGDVITINGYGFTNVATNNQNRITATFDTTENIITATNNVRTDATGSFETTFTVPSLDDGTYDVTAKDGASNTDTKQFTIGPVLTLTPAFGPTGIFVEVEGRGFTNSSTATVTITFDGEEVVKDLALTESKSKGYFNTGFYVPQTTTTVPKNVDVIATDSANTGNPVTETFVLTGLPGVTVTPVVAARSAQVKITGENFTRIANNIVNLYLVAEGTNVRQSLAGSIVVDSNTGKFEITLSVPAGIGYGAYALIAEETYNGLNAKTIFGYARPEVLAPDDVKSGQTITVLGDDFDRFEGSQLFADYGYTPAIANITIGDLLVAKNVLVTTLVNPGIPVIVPTLPVGQYVLTITSNITGLEASKTINVVETTKITVIPATTTRESTVNITGTCFIAGTVVDLTIRNASTNAQTPALIYVSGSLTTDVDGRFSIIYQIPTDYKIGDYVVNGTQVSGVSVVTAKASLKVVNLDLTITTGAAKYAQGDKGSFQLVSTTTPSGYIEIFDCNGTFYKTIAIHEANWRINEVTGLYTYPVVDSGIGAGIVYGTTFDLTSDAPIGNWTWKAYIKDANDVVPFNGKFEVISKAEGTQGPAGPQGPQGATGPQGPAGSGSGSGSGSQGPKGDTGSTGPKGEPGAKGDTGSTGPKGEPGTSADTTEASTWATTGVVLAIVALVIGAVAAFLAITLRRRIAS
jgi:hypothetical protein